LYVKPDEDARPGEAVSTLIEALKRLGESEGVAPARGAPGLVEGLLNGGGKLADPASALYAALRDGLARLEREARRHAEFVEKLTAPKAEAVTPAVVRPYQETLYLQGAAGARTAGRFRAFNRRDKKVSVSTLSRPFTIDGQPAREAPLLTLRPSAFYLDPGEARVLTVEAELPGPGRYESCLDLTMDDAVALKLWIEIDVYP
jgi:hypothetical protein